MQEVNFASLPGAKAFEQLPKLGLITSFLKEGKANIRSLKRFMREQDIYDGESFETLLAFLQVDASNEKNIKPGPFLTKLGETIDPEQRKRLLFKHLTSKNEILMKYVMDGLMEHLHSTNELYRYLTSYVYPGTYITLVNFRHWMVWLEASEHIRMVGIRWGLSELGLEGIDSIIKLIDIDDILEGEWDDDDDDDEGDDDEAAGDDFAADDDEADVELASGAGVSELEAAEEVLADALDDTGVEAEVSDTAVRAPVERVAEKKATARVAEGEVIVGRSVEYVVQPLRPKVEETPLQLVREAFAQADEEEVEDEYGDFDTAPKVRIEQFRIDESLLAENLRALQFWWRQRPGGKVLTAADYGIEKSDFEEEPAFALFRLSALALQLLRYQGRLNVSRGGQSYAILEQMGFYTNLFKSKKSVDNIVDALLKGGLGQHSDYFSNLHLLLVLRRNLKELKDDGVRALFAKEYMADLVASLWEALGSFTLSYEIIWVARELATMGLLGAEDALSVGVLPLPKVRETAFRLGFIETPYAADFSHLVSISRRLTTFFGHEDAWEAPLVYFEPKRDLRYDSSEPAYFTRDQLGIDG
ncbi:MAG: hypothetical protein ACOX8U_11115 [Bradymonadia bacterium]|jgi:hypothetical protein